MTPHTLREVGRLVWDMSEVEQAAVSTCQVILSADRVEHILTDAEQRFVVERFRPDETSHTQRFASWAAKLFGPKPSRQLPYGALVHKEMLLSSISPRLRFASCVATLCWNEKYALKSARRVVPILSLVDPGLGRTYAEVMDEERAHVEWGLAVIKRMESDRPDIFKMMEVYGNYVRTIYPIIMNHIHPKVYKRVLRESRSATQ